MRRNVSKSYDDEMKERELDRMLKDALARGDSEKKIDAILDLYEPPKPAPAGEIL